MLLLLLTPVERQGFFIPATKHPSLELMTFGESKSQTASVRISISSLSLSFSMYVLLLLSSKAFLHFDVEFSHSNPFFPYPFLSPFCRFLFFPSRILILYIHIYSAPSSRSLPFLRLSSAGISQCASLYIYINGQQLDPWWITESGEQPVGSRMEPGNYYYSSGAAPAYTVVVVVVVVRVLLGENYYASAKRIGQRPPRSSLGEKELLICCNGFILLQTSGLEVNENADCTQRLSVLSRLIFFCFSSAQLC
jgi:hypothetical protein